MVCEDVDKTNCPPVIVFGPCETLTCKFCGSEYPSRGKNDPGYCRKCEQKIIEDGAALTGSSLIIMKEGENNEYE